MGSWRIALLVAAWSVGALAQSEESAFAGFVRGIAEAIPPAVVLEVRDSTKNPALRMPEIERQFVRALTEAGIEVVAGDEGERLRITLSENRDGPLWVAEIPGDPNQIAMFWIPPRDWAGAPEPETSRVEIRRERVFEQSGAMLDFGVAEGRLVVLEPSRVVVYDRSADPPAEIATIPIPQRTPPSRDPRGRLAVFPGAFQAYLPGGLYCTGVLGEEPVIRCDGEESRWPLDGAYASMVTGRNYFDGRLTGSAPGELPPFYTALSAGGGWLVTGLDGMAHLFHDQRVIGSFDGWGSDVTGVDTACAAGRHVLATAPGGAGGDQLVVYDIIGSRAVVQSAPVALPGPVTALWTGGGAAVRMVIRNPDTDRYAAYRVSVVCTD